jgi:hypothetical protein
VYREVNEMPKCASCGKLLNVEGIRGQRLGRPVQFCTPQCERTFDTYKEPKYGARSLDGVPEIA